MVLDEHRQRLWASLHQLREAWIELRLTVREDVPRDGGAMAADELGDRIDDGLGALEEAIAASARLLDAGTSTREAGAAVALAGERLAEATRLHWRELAAHQRQTELRALARRRGPEWTAWHIGVSEALTPLPDRLETAEASLRGATLELLEATRTTEPSKGQET